MWLIGIGILVVLLLWAMSRRSRKPKRPEITGMSAKDIGEIADSMWDEWKGG